VTFVCVRTPDRVSWFEDEKHYYDGDPTIFVEFDAKHTTWTVHTRRRTTRAMTPSVGQVLLRLTNFPTSDVTPWLTHVVPEPGAPLEPIEEVTA
jgi:hypothetical protein